MNDLLRQFETLKRQLYAGSYLDEALVLGLILVVGLGVYFVGRVVLERLLESVTRKTTVRWDDLLAKHKLGRNLAWFPAAILVFYGAEALPHVEVALKKLVYLWMTLQVVVTLLKLLDVANHIYERSTLARKRPLKSVTQLMKIFLMVLGALFAFSIITETPPIAIVSSLGALTALFLLIFRDTILSFVASVAIASNDLLRKGDWITMESFGADGDVVDFALHSVQVQNFDKTITAIPTHKFLEHSFKNWRAMQECGGRRIKRSLHIDVASVHLATPDELAKWETIHLVGGYVHDKELELEFWNREQNINTAAHPLNGRRQTNLGVFRAYARAYIEHHPMVHTDGMTLIVRQQDMDGAQGVPLEIYCFAKTTEWVPFEAVQADIFDHLLAAMPYFGLRAYQRVAQLDDRDQAAPAPTA